MGKTQFALNWYQILINAMDKNIFLKFKFQLSLPVHSIIDISFWRKVKKDFSKDDWKLALMRSHDKSTKVSFKYLNRCQYLLQTDYPVNF